MAYIGSRPDNVVSRQSSKTYRYTATAGQTVFSGADQDNQILAITPSDAEVHMNGLMLDPTDYTLTGTSVTLSTAATAGDELTVTGRQTFEVADTYTKTAADSRYVNTTGDTMTGGLNVLANVGIGTSAPSANLDVASSNATIHLTDTDDTTYAEIRNNGGTFTIASDEGAAATNSSINFRVDGTERMRIDSAGRVTMPYQPVFSARHTALSGVNASSSLNLGSGFWDAAYLQDNLGNFNTSTGRFTAPVSGWYYFGHHMRIDNFGGSYIYTSISTSGGLVARNLTNLSWTYNTLSCQGITYMTANDYCYMSLHSVGDTSIDINSDGYFVGHLIG